METCIDKENVSILNNNKKSEKIVITESLIKKIGSIADKLNFKVYIVGGYVRDYFLDRPRHDFDFTVIGDCLEFAEHVAVYFNTKAVLYPKFRTALVPIGDFKCEFVGTRKETYLKNSRKPVVEEGTLEDDLKRRDFTVNAMAVSVNKENFGDIIDLFNGYEDLGRKILKTPLDPITTYSEDPLRMLRAARFASQLGFELENNSLVAAKSIANRIKIISQERISDEFLKIIASPKPSIGINLLDKMELLQYVFYEIYSLKGIETKTIGNKEYAHKDVYKHTLQVLDSVSTHSDNLWLRFAALVHDIAKPKTKSFIDGTGWSFHGHEDVGAKYMDKIFRRMKLPLEHLEYVKTLVRLHQRPMALVDDGVSDSAVRRLAFQSGAALEDLFLLCRCDITTNNPKLSQKYLNNYQKVFEKVVYVQEKDKLREFQSPVRGEEIMEICSLKPSPAVGIIKKTIEEAILDGIIPNEYDAAKKYFLNNKNIWLKEIEEGIRKK